MQTFKPSRVILAFLILTNFLRMPAMAQVPAGLRITIVEGEGAINNVRQRVNRDPIVQVEDDNRRPIGGAIVTFFLPDTGPSGTFVNGTRQLTLTTNAEGRATATGIRPNNQVGQMQIRVTASFQGLTASTVITQSNAAGAATSAGMSAGTKVLIFLGIAGAVAAGAVIATTGGGSKSPSGPAPVPPIVITPGTPTVGGPR